MRVALALLFTALLSCGQARAQAAPAQGGATNPDAAEAARLNSEVVRLYGQGKYDEALPLARRVVELREKSLGADHPAVAGALHNLGTLLVARKEYGEAEKVYQRALAVAEKGGAAQAEFAGEVSTQLGLLRFRAGDYAAAERHQMRGLALKEQARGATHAGLLPNLLNLVEVQLVRRDFDMAEEYLGRVLTILRAQPPKKDLVTAERIKGYLCPLLGARESELAGKVREAMFRLREPEQAAARDQEVAGKKRVAGGVLNGRVVRSVPPSYPNAARARRLSGTVVVGITVNEEGKVIEAEPLCGHEALAGAAVEAVREWRFSPTLLEGQPVKVTGTVTVNFVLQ